MDYLKGEHFDIIPSNVDSSGHRPRILILYGSLRDRSYSRLLAEEAGRILEYMGAEVKLFNPDGLPVFDYQRSIEHPKVQELRDLSLWSEGQVWSSPELHGNMSGVLKNQIDWWNFQILSALVDVVQYCKIEAITQSATQLLTSTTQTIHKTFIQASENEDGKSKIISSTTRAEHVPLFEDYVMFAESQLRFYEISGQESFKETGLKTLEFIYTEFFEENMFYTRSIKHHDSQLYENIHVPIFDQSYKAPIATLFGLVRKWQTSSNLMELLEKSTIPMETLTHLSLQNPLMFGESLRSLVYPDEAYRKIEIPQNWLKENKFGKYYPHFSARFAINFHEKENWQICTYKECELAGDSLEEFDKIFSPPQEEA